MGISPLLVYDRNRKFGRNFRIQQFSVYESEVGKNLSTYVHTCLVCIYCLASVSLKDYIRIEVLISAKIGKKKKIKYMVTQCTLPIVIIILDAFLIQLFRYSCCE